MFIDFVYYLFIGEMPRTAFLDSEIFAPPKTVQTRSTSTEGFTESWRTFKNYLRTVVMLFSFIQSGSGIAAFAKAGETGLVSRFREIS
jgi:hypothetical protein